MNKRFVRAALMACLLGTAGAAALTVSMTPAYAAKPTGPTVSNPVGKLLQPASTAMAANDFPTALGLIKQAQALPDQTPFDTYKINEFLGNVYIKMNDHVNAEVAFAAMADSPALGDVAPEEKATALRVAALLSIEQKHYDKGLKYAAAFNALGGAPDALVLAEMAQAYYYSNDFTNAEAYSDKALAAVPPGGTPDRGALEVKFGAQLKAKKQDDAIKTLETIITYYNDADEWGQLIDVSLGVKGIKDFEALHIYRLRPVVKATAHPEDYKVMSALAMALAYPVEAETVLQSGGQPVSADIRTRAAGDRKTIDSFVATAQKAATGELDLKAAETLYGYGRYADAEAAARRAIQKGGAKTNVNEANLVLAEALLLQGKTADGTAALNAITAPSPGMAKAQHLWLIYAGRKY